MALAVRVSYRESIVTQLLEHWSVDHQIPRFDSHSLDKWNRAKWALGGDG